MKQANIANVAVTEKHSEQLEEKKCINSIKFESESFENPDYSFCSCFLSLVTKCRFIDFTQSCRHCELK